MFYGLRFNILSEKIIQLEKNSCGKLHFLNSNWQIPPYCDYLR